MRCWKQYLGVSGAGLCGAGSVAGIVVSAGVATIPGILGTIGSLLFLISALNELAECLESKGKDKEAARLRKRIDALERDVERLKRLAT